MQAIEAMITDALTLADPFLKFTQTVWDPKAFWKVSSAGKRLPSSSDLYPAGLWILLVFSRHRYLSLWQSPERHRNALSCAGL